MVGHPHTGNYHDSTRSNTYRRLTLGLLALITILILSTFGQYGMSWDEYYRFKSGDVKLNYYKQLFSGQEASAGVDHYPGLFDLTLAVVHPYFPWSRITTGHFMSSLFGIAAIVGVAMTSRMFGGWAASFWAILFLITLPRFYGHIFFNPKDIPFAATYIWGLYFLIKYLYELLASKLDGPSWSTTIWLGIAFGTCMSMRIGGLILFCYWAMALSIAMVIPAIRKSIIVTGTKQALTRIMPQLIVSGIIASLILLFWWPYAHGNFVSATSSTLGKITAWQASSTGWQLHVLFDGHNYKDTDLPFYYWPWMFFITTPLFHLLLVIVGVACAIAYFGSKVKVMQDINRHLLPHFIIVFAAIFPVAFVVIGGSNVFDGIRHLLFVLTPLSVCAGIMIAKTLNTYLSQSSQNVFVSLSPFWSALFRAVPLPLLFILMALPTWSMIKLHPYQYTFYNALVGGTEGASSHYETDYWGTSNRAAVEALVAHLKHKDSQFSKNTYLISSSNGSWLSSRYFPGNFEFTAQREFADFYIGNTRFHGHEALDGKTIIEIKAGDALFCVVKDRREQKKIWVRHLLDARIKERGVKGH